MFAAWKLGKRNLLYNSH